MLKEIVNKRLDHQITPEIHFTLCIFVPNIHYYLSVLLDRVFKNPFKSIFNFIDAFALHAYNYLIQVFTSTKSLVIVIYKVDNILAIVSKD